MRRYLSALQVCESFVSSEGPTPETNNRKTFVYISAEDTFRPIVPAGYILSKRQAEQGIDVIMRKHPFYRGIYIRPSEFDVVQGKDVADIFLGLVYHAHYRPLTTPLAAFLDLSSAIHKTAPSGFPTPSSVLRLLSSAVAQVQPDSIASPLSSMANALTIPPIHVDHVADAICKSILDDRVDGIVDVARMRDIIGWTSSTDPSSRTEYSSSSLP